MKKLKQKFDYFKINIKKIKNILKSDLSYAEKIKMVSFLNKTKKDSVLVFYNELYKNKQSMKNLSEVEYLNIKDSLKQLGVDVIDYCVNVAEFNDFCSEFANLYNSSIGENWILKEKLLEHYISYKFLDLKNYNKEDVFVDVAACTSSYAKILREKGIKAYAIDLVKSDKFKDLEYYQVQDACKTIFKDKSVKGMSLQCAYEMFMGEDDKDLIKEASRVLESGGKLVISPLYMHNDYCYTISSNIYDDYTFNDGAFKYIRFDYADIVSRKYNIEKLLERVIDTATKCGMKSKIYFVNNLSEIDERLYLHFILEVSND